MILVTGGAGFIGSHTVRALHELGQRCVLLQRSRAEVPSYLADLDVELVRGDVADLDTLLEAGRRHRITGIAHLAVALPAPGRSTDPVGEAERRLRGLLNVVAAATTWGVSRVLTASTIGVYGGARPDPDGGLREDAPVSLQHHHAIPTFKKIDELLGAHLAQETGVEVLTARISGTWGPRGHRPDPFFCASELAYAAAHGLAVDLSGQLQAPYAEDGLDLSYVKDTARALALLQTTPQLRHVTYNVASGRTTTNAEIIAAIRQTEPDFVAELPSAGPRQASWMDIARLRADTGFAPSYDTAAAAADYIAWFRDQA